MRKARWRAARNGSVVVILTLEALTLAGLGLSWFVVGSLTGPFTTTSSATEGTA